MKLPKLELRKFDGNVFTWQEFWDAFDSTIHQNEILQRPDKFNYLRSQLVGWANESIARLDLQMTITMSQSKYLKNSMFKNKF